MSPESTYTVLNSRSIQNGQFYTILFFSSFLRPFCIVFHQDASLSHSTLPMGSSKNLSGGRHLGILSSQTFFGRILLGSRFFGPICSRPIFSMSIFWAPVVLCLCFWSQIFHVQFLSAQSGEERGCDLKCVFL